MNNMPFSKEFKKIIEISEQKCIKDELDGLYLVNILITIVQKEEDIRAELSKFNILDSFLQSCNYKLDEIKKSFTTHVMYSNQRYEKELLLLVQLIKDDASSLKRLSRNFLIDSYLFFYKFFARQEPSKNNIIKNIENIDDFYQFSKLVYEKILKDRVSKSNPSYIQESMPEFIDKKQSTSLNNTPFLNDYSKDLTLLARQNKLDPVIGRDVEIIRTIQILIRRIKSNPMLIGEPGVGKTAIIEGVAQKISQGNVPSFLANKRLLVLDINSIVAGTKYRGEFEERLKKIIKEAISAKNIIFFIDEIHSIIGAGSAEGSLDISNIIKPSLAKGELQFIGATTTEEYQRYFEKDSALSRRFQNILIEEPSKELAFEMIKNLKEVYEKHHNVKYTESALFNAVEKAARYITNRFLPDKAIDLIDEAASHKRVLSQDFSKNSKEEISIKGKITRLEKKKSKLSKEENFQQATIIRDEIHSLKNNLYQINLTKQDKIIEVTEDDINETISKITSIPISRLKQEDNKKFLGIEKELSKSVIGQEESIQAIASALRRNKTGISDEKRPMGSFLFLGSTGVGKTLVAKILALNFFGSDKKLIKLDMSEYMERGTSSKLIGTTPGYVGYEDSGYLVKTIKTNPYSVVLFDEIEKAHSSVLNILLQILEDGEVRDGQNNNVSFKNTIIIMTSNIGSESTNFNENNIGFTNIDRIEDYDNFKKETIKALEKKIKPEIVNRIDDIIVFRPISKDVAIEITKLQIKELVRKLESNNYNIKIEKSLIEHISIKGFDKRYGARAIKRTIKNELEDKISIKILEGKIKPNSKTVTISVNKFNEVCFSEARKTALKT